MELIVTHPDGSQMPLFSKERTSAVTKAEQSVSLLADDTVSITVQSATPLQFALGDTVEAYGKTYTLNQLPTIKKTGDRRFSYDLIFEGVQYELIDAQLLLPDDTVGDSLTGDLFTFLQILVSNANRVFPGKWSVGEYPADTEYKTLTFTGDNCLAALQRLCEEYQQEFEIVQATSGARTLHIRKAGVVFPYTFRYGRTGGLYELTRQNISSKNVVTRLYAYGGSSNVPNSYLTGRSSSKLCLPGKNKNTSYIEDAAAVAAFGVKENTHAFDDIFPNRYGAVTAKGSAYYAFVDSTMNFNLNETDGQGNTLWLINGVAAKVHFNTGNLAGYEFDVHKYDHATRTIEVVPFQDENGMEFPSKTSAAFQFAPGDKYFFIDINLPDAYITQAEQKLYGEAQAYYEQNSQPQVQYSLQVDENFIRQFAGQLTVVNLFAVGDYIPIQDTDIGVDKSVRITGFTRDLLKPYKYAITLADTATKSAYVRMVASQRETNRIIEINNLADPAKARRSWRSSQEVLSMVFDPDGDYYSEKIKPLSIETSMLQVGAKSMQFVLQNVIFEPNYQGNPNYIRVSSGNLIHYTIAESITFWSIAATEFSQLAGNTAYYIYARCQQSGSAGNIILDTAQRKVDYETGYYTFWVGVLNSVVTDDEGLRPARLISLTYGSTTVNGRFIKTGRIESTDGETYFDLDNGEIGGKISFRTIDGASENLAEKILGLEEVDSNNHDYTLNAVNAASAAQNTASSAADTASNAQSTANSAFTTASDAQSTAGGALSLASDAIYAANALSYLKDAIQNGSTEIAGGLAMTNILFMKNLQGAIRAGMSGLDGDNIGAWFGGTYQDALNDLANIVFRKDGTGYIGNAEVSSEGDLYVLGDASEVMITPSTVEQAAVKSGFNYKEVSKSVIVAGTTWQIRSNSTADLTWTDAYNDVTGPTTLTLPTKSKASINYNVLLNAKFVVRFGTFNTSNPNAGYITVDNASIKFGAKTNSGNFKVDGGNNSYNKEVAMTFGLNNATGKYECSGICQLQNTTPQKINKDGSIQFLFDVKFTIHFPIYQSDIYIEGYFLEAIDDNTPIFTAIAIPPKTLICSNGILVSDGNGKSFSISNANGIMSVKGGFPQYSSANSGEICVVSSGGYNSLVLK
jgi:hypothetical protein